MSENKQVYVHSGIPVNLEAFRNLDCTRPYCSDEYVPPTPSQVKALIDFMGWSQREVALITGVSHNEKGSTAVRKWKTPVNKSESRAIPYAAWRQMLEVAGVVSVDEVREVLQNSSR